MATYKTGGALELHYSDDATLDSWTKAFDIVSSENLPETSIDQQTPDGSYQSGKSLNPKFMASDHTNKASIEALALGNTRAKKYWAVVYADGNIERTERPQFPKVLNEPKPRVADGDNLWSVTIDVQCGWVNVASLTA